MLAFQRAIMAETNVNYVGKVSLVGRLMAISFEGYT